MWAKKEKQEKCQRVNQNQEYPNQWAEGVRVAIPKSGGTDIRPITITPNIAIRAIANTGSLRVLIKALD